MITQETGNMGLSLFEQLPQEILLMVLLFYDLICGL